MTDRPSIVYIVADDLGHADLGCYGGRPPSVSSVLDVLAAEGLRLTDGYANAPVCSPTRFALMTGRWQYRLRGAADEPLGGNARGSSTLGLPGDHPTLPSLLRDAGYRTALVGKWHLGYPPTFGPLKSGYESFYGALSGGLDYWTHADFRGVHDLWDGDAEAHDAGYLTDLISARAADFVNAHAGDDRPIFLSVHYTAPHWPWETRDDEALAAELRGKLFHLTGGSVETYRRMVAHMDEGIGSILRAVDRTGRAANTIVVFTSDNGGERFSDNWPLVGGKMDLTEGGIRVPWIPVEPSRLDAMRTDWEAWNATLPPIPNEAVAHGGFADRDMPQR